ncbi:histone-lysine N-methyltransferase 2B-like [Portunus trituberculatus]|uniref:histone-lysine N-methyltransferase 2B-like n=1 Tax=Portunus trituberculatus TaxID=210409 RepID=UPI001E1CCB16|nr:histone-lysine N-methyltransferase 2B-like [Portunus trituberculatus]
MQGPAPTRTEQVTTRITPRLPIGQSTVQFIPAGKSLTQFTPCNAGNFTCTTQWLGYAALTREARVRFPAREKCQSQFFNPPQSATLKLATRYLPCPCPRKLPDPPIPLPTNTPYTTLLQTPSRSCIGPSPYPDSPLLRPPPYQYPPPDPSTATSHALKPNSQSPRLPAERRYININTAIIAFFTCKSRRKTTLETNALRCGAGAGTHLEGQQVGPYTPESPNWDLRQARPEGGGARQVVLRRCNCLVHAPGRPRSSSAPRKNQRESPTSTVLNFATLQLPTLNYVPLKLPDLGLAHPLPKPPTQSPPSPPPTPDPPNTRIPRSA